MNTVEIIQFFGAQVVTLEQSNAALAVSVKDRHDAFAADSDVLAVSRSCAIVLAVETRLDALKARHDALVADLKARRDALAASHDALAVSIDQLSNRIARLENNWSDHTSSPTSIADR